MRSCFHDASALPKAKPKELQIRIRHAADLRLLFVEFQKQLSLHVGLEVSESPLRRLPAPAEDHHVVGVPNETVPSAFELMVELVEHDVGENGADWTALRRSYFAWRDLVPFLYRCSQDLVDE